jgi:hypothetical protein
MKRKHKVFKCDKNGNDVLVMDMTHAQAADIAGNLTVLPRNHEGEESFYFCLRGYFITPNAKDELPRSGRLDPFVIAPVTVRSTFWIVSVSFTAPGFAILRVIADKAVFILIFSVLICSHLVHVLLIRMQEVHYVS